MDRLEERPAGTKARCWVVAVLLKFILIHLSESCNQLMEVSQRQLQSLYDGFTSRHRAAEEGALP